MKKIGILSVKTYNYGSLLQTYALQKYVTLLGYENELVNYKKNSNFRQLCRLLYLPLFIDVIKRQFKKKVAFCIHPEYKDCIKNRNNIFLLFLKEYIHESTPIIGRKSLISEIQKYQCVLLGSDQIWHPFNYGAHFFDMSFVPDSIAKIAYAPSFGVSSLPSYQQKKMSNSIKRINALSVREESGQNLIKKLTNRDAIVVCDPTMLLTKEMWNSFMSKRIIETDYIFCYFIGNNPSHRDFAQRLSTKTGLPIVTLRHIYCFQNIDKNFGNITPQNVGPQEFVSLIAHANYICTDSFHGTVFSIINEKQMFTFARFSESKMSANSRLSTLFDKLGITGRYISPNITIDEALSIPMIDYKTVISKLEEYRSFSRTYLKNNLNKFCTQKSYEE